MSKRAGEAALKAYPEKMGMFHEADIHYEADLNKAARIKYIEGYKQAEKDLALTWEDMVLLRTLFDATDAHQAMGALTVQPMTREYYEFLLQEFNKMKNK